ncbi:MAG: 2-hydroxyacid dehydrogenase [Bacteroidia bacterium]
MKVAVYSAHDFEREYLLESNAGKHELVFISSKLRKDTINLSAGCEALTAFVSDDLESENLVALYNSGIKHIALRSAGYNHVNLSTANKLGMNVARVPAYSPNSVAEHAVSLMLALNRKLIKSNQRIHQLNFSLNGLVGFDMNGKTVGIIGMGKIGSAMAKIMHGFGCRILACDKLKREDLVKNYGVKYVDLETLCKSSDIITLHVPLSFDTLNIINKRIISVMKQGVMLINTGRGKLVNTKHVIEGIENGKIGNYGMDVYEDETLFFEDHTGENLKDEHLAKLMLMDNVLITGHHAFLTKEALENIALETIYNLDCFAKGIHSRNSLNIIQHV